MATNNTPQYHVEIEIDYYDYSNGYSHTETFDDFDAENLVTAETYWSNLDGQEYFDPRKQQTWYRFTAIVYAYEADEDGNWLPEYDDCSPVLRTSFDVDEATPYFAEKYAEEDGEEE